MIQRILEIENDSFTCPWSEDSFVSAFNSPTIHINGAVDEEEKLVGFSCLQTIADEGEILNIAVSRESRQCGIGSKLMAYMLKYAKNIGVGTLFLEVRDSNIPARKMYESFGFVPISVRKRYYSNPDEDAIIMMLKL